MIFPNSALMFYLPGVCTHSEGKQRKARVRNMSKYIYILFPLPTSRPTSFTYRIPVAWSYIAVPSLEVNLPYDPVCPSIGRSVCHDFKFHFPCPYRNTCFDSLAPSSFFHKTAREDFDNKSGYERC